MLYNEYGASTEIGNGIAKKYATLTKSVLDKYPGIPLPELLSLCIDEISCIIAEEKMSRATKLKKSKNT